MYLRCTSDVTRMYISFSRIFPSCYIWVHLVLQMYVNVICTFSLRCMEMYLIAKCIQMYSRCTRNVLQMYISISQNGRVFFRTWMYLNVRKCTKMHSKCMPNVLQMYAKCTPKCTFRFPGFSKNSGNRNVPKCTFAYISNVLQMYPQMYPGCTFRFPGFSQNSGNPNVPKCTFSYI